MSEDHHVNQCTAASHTLTRCNACKQFTECAFIYNLDHADSDCTSDEGDTFFRAYNLFYTDTYGKGMTASKRLGWCDVTNLDASKNAEMSMTLYSVYGPSCDVGERFQVYQGIADSTANGFCYCGPTCDKTYTNPLLDYLLSILIGLMAIHILFNFGRYWRYALLNASSTRKSYKSIVPGRSSTRRSFGRAVRGQQQLDREKHSGWRAMKVEPGIPLPHMSAGGGLAQRVGGS